jgi:hypothetical protein
MKSSLAIVILLTLISISVFGFVGLPEMHRAMGEGCPGNLAAATPCPVNDGVFAFSIFHLKSLQGLSQSGFLNISPMFLLTVILLAFAFALIVSADSSGPLSIRSYFKKNYEDKVRDEGPKMISWLSHLENSPAFVKGA